MHFCLVDAILERSEDRIVTLKHVSAAEEYLQDHFPGFPVLPGVMMIEAMVQSARALLEPRRGPERVLGSARGVKYGRFVRPGESLRVEVRLLSQTEDGAAEFRGEGVVLRIGAEPGAAPAELGTAVSGRFVLRPVRTVAPARAAAASLA